MPSTHSPHPLDPPRIEKPMPPPRSADHFAAPSPQRGTVDALITQTRRLRGGIAAVRRDATADLSGTANEPQLRWQRALCDLAVHHLDDLGQHLDQLREGLPPEQPGETDGAGQQDQPLDQDAPRPAPGPAASTGPGSLLNRVGSAEWNLLTDEVTWSDELCQIFGRGPEEGGLSLDELPSWVVADDQPVLTAMVTDCLVDGKPIEGEVRGGRTDDAVRPAHIDRKSVV